MNILYLGPYNGSVISFLRKDNNHVYQCEDPVNTFLKKLNNYDFIISYGYRYIIPETVIQKFFSKIINLHISYLPWNRGADPNFWSIFEHSIKGVSIHYIDKGIDTGDIIVQKRIKFSKKDTLSTSYRKLHIQIEELFYKNWCFIKENTCKRIKQKGKGSVHVKKDIIKYTFLLPLGWNTPIKQIEDYKRSLEKKI